MNVRRRVSFISFRCLSPLGSLALTVVKLLKTKLYTRYRIFFAYLVFQALCLSLALLLPPNSTAYFYLWVFTHLSWFFYIGMVLELYRLILERHRGLYTSGPVGDGRGTVISVTISALALLPRITPRCRKIAAYGTTFTAGERGVDFSLAIFFCS